MKNNLYLLFALITCLFFSSCAVKVQNTKFDPNNECPDDEPCLHYSTEGATSQSTTVQKTTAIIEKQKGKVVAVTPLYNGQAPDRITNMIDNATSLGGTLGGAAIERDGVVSAAKHTADGLVKAAKIKADGNPEILINNRVSSNSSSFSDADADADVKTGDNNLKAEQNQDQTTGIGISLLQQYVPPLGSSGAIQQ